MATQYDDDNRFDRILLIARRIFLLLFILLIAWIVLFKIIGIGKDKGINLKSNTTNLSGDINDIDHGNNNGSVDKKLSKEASENGKIKNGIYIYNNDIKNIGKNYGVKGSKVYYMGEIIDFVDMNDFIVLDEDGEYTANGTVINSDNLLKIFGISERRRGLMHEIDDIIKNEVNVTDQLKGASENGMYKMGNEYSNLSKLDWNDRYDMTEGQRAKFAIMFLYVKIIKSYSNDRIQMKLALNELKNFIDNFDKDILRDEKDEEDLNKIEGDIGMDNHCIYKNGELYTCFLDKIFVK